MRPTGRGAKRTRASDVAQGPAETPLGRQPTQRDAGAGPMRIARASTRKRLPPLGRGLLKGSSGLASASRLRLESLRRQRAFLLRVE